MGMYSAKTAMMKYFTFLYKKTFKKIFSPQVVPKIENILDQSIDQWTW